MPEALSSPAFSLLNRRSFLVRTGTATAATLLFAACKDPVPPATPTITFTAGDEGVLNYLLLLARFSGDFYTTVLATPPSDLTAAELAVLRDISRHSFIYRELLLLAFGDTGLTISPGARDIAFNYEPFTLTTRAGVLAAAQTIDDLTTAAYCGMAKLWTNAALLGLQMKIMAVKARHAATIRDLRTAGSFAASDVVPTTGTGASLNQVLTPTDVLAELSKYTTPIVLAVGALPTN